MMTPKTLAACAVLISLVYCNAQMSHAQVQTEVPPVVPGAKPVTVEHIKVHGASLEGNLEGDAVDRDVIVFLPPSYSAEDARAGIPSCTRCTAIPSGRSSGRTRSTCRRPSRAPSPWAPGR